MAEEEVEAVHQILEAEVVEEVVDHPIQVEVVAAVEAVHLIQVVGVVEEEVEHLNLEEEVVVEE